MKTGLLLRHPSASPRLRVLLSLALLFFAAGCDLLGGDDDDAPVTTGVLVANQGNFTQGNGSVSAYDPETGEVSAAVVDGLGAIVQSLLVHGGRLYVVANTGDRVDVFDAATYAQVGQIDGLVSPRYMVRGPGRKGYVTNQYGAPGTFTGGSVSVVDLVTFEKLKDVAVGDNPEGLAAYGDRLYVANHSFGGGHTISVIDVAADTLVATFDAGCDGPRFVFPDDTQLHVFCTGQTLYDENFNVIGETNGAVRVLDRETGQIVKRIDLDGRISTPGPGQDATLDTRESTIYFVLDGRTVVRFDTARDEVAGRIGPLEGALIGAVAADPLGDRLYVGRVPGFTERGSVTIFDGDGNEVGSFAAGVAPAYIAFQSER